HHHGGPMRHLLTVIALALACSPAFAADTPKKEPSEKQKAQQQRMKDCSVKSKGMKGKDHQDFMSKCLSGDNAAPPAKADSKGKGDEKKSAKASQQDKMKTCNKEASAKSLKGKDRESFMSSCLKG